MLQRFGRSSQAEVEQAEDALAERDARAACSLQLLEHVNVRSRLFVLSAQRLDGREIDDVPGRSPRLSDVEREAAALLRDRVSEVEPAAAGQLRGLCGKGLRQHAHEPPFAGQSDRAVGMR